MNSDDVLKIMDRNIHEVYKKGKAQALAVENIDGNILETFNKKAKEIIIVCLKNTNKVGLLRREKWKASKNMIMKK